MTIKELRNEKGMTLAAFAKSIGIGMSTLTGYEDRKSTRLNSSHPTTSRMPSSA